MREIKFRGICITPGEFKGRWVYGDLLQKNGKTYITPHSNYVQTDGGHIGRNITMHEVGPETVGQMTGIKDRNGAEIYEGDVARDEYGDIGVIEFHKSWASFFFSLKLRNDDGELKPILSARPMWNEWGSLEVVGNSFEHPHLLERPEGIESTEQAQAEEGNT